MNNAPVCGAMSGTPFIIWTLQRTGGTNLAQGLFERIKPVNAYHEPFNTGRIYGSIVEQWKDTNDREKLKLDIIEICRSGVCFKHCVEEVPQVVNDILIEVSIEFGYSHLFLYRKDAISRLLSYYFARQTGVWGKKKAKSAVVSSELFKQPLPIDLLIKHERKCVNRLDIAWGKLQINHSRMFAISFEDIYEAKSAYFARKALLEVITFLGLNVARPEVSALDKIIGQGSQGTRELYSDFPGVDVLQTELAKYKRFRPATRQDLFQINYPKIKSESALFVDVKVRVPEKNASAIFVSGIVLLADGAEDMKLILRVGELVNELSRGLPSPLLAKRFPLNTNARSARFNSNNISFKDDDIAQIILVDSSGIEHVICEINKTETQQLV